MKEKDKLLQKHKQRSNTIKTIQKRVQCYELANNLLSNIYFESTTKLIHANSFPNPLQNHLATTFLDEIMNKAASHYRIISNCANAVEGVFEKDVVEGITAQGRSPKEIREKAKLKKEGRMINRKGNARCVRVLYLHDYLHFSNFSKYLNRHLQGSLQ